jgi:50S ribosome-binding GTPase
VQKHRGTAARLRDGCGTIARLHRVPLLALPLVQLSEGTSDPPWTIMLRFSGVRRACVSLPATPKRFASSKSVGLLGLPNVGKSSIFNALVRSEYALVSNRPFATIDPNRANVQVPDPRIHELAKLSGSQKTLGWEIAVHGKFVIESDGLPLEVDASSFAHFRSPLSTQTSPALSREPPKAPDLETLS